MFIYFRLYVEYEVLTAVDKNTYYIFWDVTQFSPLKVNRRFGGTYRLHLQGQIINQVRNQREADSKQSAWNVVV
jgi:hypothetical protein